MKKAKEKVGGFISEFKEFALKGNVLDMAVGVIIGSAFSAIVNSLVKDIITPVISIITGGTDLTDLKAILRPEVLDDAGEIVTPALTLNYGVFIQAVINFLIIAFPASTSILASFATIPSTVAAPAPTFSSNSANE